MRRKDREFAAKVDAALDAQSTKPKLAPKLESAAEVLRKANASGDPSGYLKARAKDPVVREVYDKWRATTRLGKNPLRRDG